ncbi:hypothetical protein [Leptolyngbya sp. PCC 6406]|uniref:hypothetical protein n=1 Tax=Leptolyngbya sp. PCC 6406 TaxID=1173264 RepID=UPI0002ACBD57|nr:hypothetical protein [Leptolyngbya sp. PCC 6406]
MNRMGKVGTIGLLMAVTVGLSGCNGLLQALGLRPGNSQAENSERIGTQSLNTTDDGNILVNETAGIQITLPASWQEDERLHNSAELQASDPTNNLYIIVLAEDERALQRFGLRENAETYRNILIRNLQAFEGGDATDVAFVGDNFATQHEIRGQVQAGTQVVYLHTTVLTENRYYQIVAWSTPDQYSFSRTELQTITESFRETSGS